MNKTHPKPATLVLGSAMLAGLALSGSAFSMQPLAQGYLVSASAATGDKAAEGKCGMDKADADKDGRISRAEFDAAHPDAGAAKFDAIDANKDGFVDAAEHKVHAEGKCGEGKCGEGKCGAAKKDDAKAGHAEGKCGEGKCGEGKCGADKKDDAKAGHAEGKCGEGKCGG
ncbi:MAG: hypothetical protein EOP91_12380, partial [Lysobacteraceae bacterium]